MLSRILLIALSAATLGASAGAQSGTSAGAQSNVPAPSAFLGIEVGADRTLADWTQIGGYFAALATASPAVELDTLGPTTQKRPFLLVTISSPENIRKIEQIRALQAKLADPRTLTTEEEARALASQPTVLLISCNIHSTEIASSQMAMELAYRLATNDTLQRFLEQTVVLLVPSMNPDGQQMVVDWYKAGLGTQWEGGTMPWLYHPYVGHDNNRDWYMVTQQETKLVTDLLYRRWFPEIFYDVHQQGSYGMRLTVPPHVDPIDPNVDPLIVRGINQVGAVMSWALESQGKTGVGDRVTYDLWWHGGARSTPTRHNMIGLLSEAASVRIATPMTIPPERLRGHERGLPRYEQRVNFPNPWPGGTWRMRDIIDYELIAAEALVRLAAQQRADYVRNFVQLGRKAVRLGETQAPYAYVIPAGQHDPSAAARLVTVLRAGGVEVDSLTAPLTVAGRTHAAGSYLVSMAQPFRAHAKDLMEVQRFPKMEQWPGGPPERPYDVAGWTLPMQMGVRVVEVTEPLTTRPRAAAVRATTPEMGFATCRPSGRARALPAANTACYREAARQLRAGKRVSLAGRSGARAATLSRLPRVALYKPWTASMDEGWTRWVLEQFELPFTTLTDSMVKAGRLRDQFDVILVPDMSLRAIQNGQRATAVPPQYAGGLGDAGLEQVKQFVQGGGTLVLLDHAAELATSVLGVDVTRIVMPPRRGSDDDDDDTASSAADTVRRRTAPVYAPGSILRVIVDARQPVGLGMPDTAAVYFTNSTTFDVPAGSPAKVIARYPERAEDILLSGFLQGGESIAGKAAAVDVPVGQGRVVMFGFRPQYRGQSHGTFRMLFNALLHGGVSARR